MKYQELVNVYEALGATTKRLEKTDILADFLIKVEEEDLEKITLMALGSVFPSWSEEEQGIGDKLVMKAVGDAVRKMSFEPFWHITFLQLPQCLLHHG